MFSWLSAGYAVGGVAWIVIAVVTGQSWSYLAYGGMWLVLAATWLTLARQYDRRDRLGSDQASPAAGPDVRALVRQGRKIEAIKRYRQLNPGIGLREARQAVDRLEPGRDDVAG